ncbi:hypothetical protein H0O02_02695 [Candidatus Micrarchaeota archaeon]|nr:hypothetical protein [Candidatus Micrarchaeota archaeon]
MAVIKKNELKEMSAKAAQAKIADLEKAILELHGEGKREKVKPLRRTIAKLKTHIGQVMASTGEKPKV